MAATSIHNEKELLQEIASGDQRAFKIIYNLYYKKIYAFCLRQVKSVELAEEILQETFLKIWLMEHELLKVNNIEAYLRTIARNRCLDSIRKMERESLAFADPSGGKLLDAHNDTEEAIMLADTRQLLQKGIDQLPPQQKLVYELCHQQGLKYEEAAQQLNISPLTVKNHMQAALRTLREYMRKNTDLAVVLILLKIF